MDEKTLWNNFKGHLTTINRHKMLVMEHCFKCGLYRQGLLHDLSKYNPIEFFRGVVYYQGDRSPNSEERRVKGYSLAWLHHKGRNKHHFEYWIDNGTGKDKHFKGMRMPDRYVAEMFCDRVAACKTYNKEKYTSADPYNYYAKNKYYYLLHPEVERLLERLLIMLRDKGEDYAFAYIRKNIAHKK